jgi:hypothetical protein
LTLDRQVLLAFNTLQYGNSPFNQGRVTIAIEQGYHIEIHSARFLVYQIYTTRMYFNMV